VVRKRRHSREFKLAALARMEGTTDVAGLAAELGISRGLLYKWNIAFKAGGAAALRLPGERAPSADRMAGSDKETAATRAEIIPVGTAALERKVAQQALELDFFRAALQHFAGHRRKSGGSGGMGSTP